MGRYLLFTLGLLLVLAVAPEASVLANTLQLDGSRQQGGLIRGRTVAGARVVMDGQEVRVSPQGYFLVGFGRDAPAIARVVVISPGGARLERILGVKPRQYRIERIDGLPPKKVTPSEEHLARIRAEVALVKKVRRRDDARTDFLDGFIWPARGRISGVYGSQRILNGKPRTPHYGVDVAAPPGTPVVAPASGVVTLAHPDMYYSGTTLILDHGHGLSSTFLHLSDILVEEGRRVEQGQVVAKVGATGRATGPHLDWRINLFQQRLDPQLLVGSMPGR